MLSLQFDEKNIRRRVYDAFNVLIAIRVIAKDKKEIKWMGLTNYRYEKIQKLEVSTCSYFKGQIKTNQQEYDLISIMFCFTGSSQRTHHQDQE